MTGTRNTHLDAGRNSRPTLISTILKIARLHTPKNKSKSWFKNLSCLRMNAASPKTLQIVRSTPYGTNNADYIAVSYSWTPTSRLECDRNGNYIVTGARGDPVRKSVVRDEVLERVLWYANHIGIDRLWIDKECSPQDNLVEKQTAMDSMDLVYRLGKHPLGLLAIVFDDQSEVNHLQMLMMGGAVARGSEDEYPRLAHSAISRTSLRIFDVLVHMYKDRWRSRAWIFQEAYLSSTAMQILIRRKQGTLTLRKFGFLHGEICLNAVDFRKQATPFLLASSESILRRTLQAIAGDRWGDVSYPLGRWGKREDAKSGKLADGEGDNWKPDLTVIKATVQYLQKTDRLTCQPGEGLVG